jgi:hypothetical protein
MGLVNHSFSLRMLASKKQRHQRARVSPGPLAAANAFGLDILLACMNTFHCELALHK